MNQGTLSMCYHTTKEGREPHFHLMASDTLELQLPLQRSFYLTLLPTQEFPGSILGWDII